MQELWHFHVGLCKSRSEAICLVVVEDAEWMLIRRLLFLVMCQLTAPSDKSCCRTTCNLCHNHQSDANRRRIFVFFAVICADSKMKNAAKLSAHLPLRCYFSSKCRDVTDRLPYGARCNAHNSQYWFFCGIHIQVSVNKKWTQASSIHSESKPFLKRTKSWMLSNFFLSFFFK